MKPDLFLLYELTNHLDIESIELFKNYIKSFIEATVIILYDRYFINKFANKTIEFENGQMYSYLGGYDDYKNEKLKKRKRI